MQLEEFEFYKNARKEKDFFFFERIIGRGSAELVVYTPPIKLTMGYTYKYRLKVVLSRVQGYYFTYGEDGLLIYKQYQPDVYAHWHKIINVMQDFNNLSDPELERILNSFRFEE